MMFWGPGLALLVALIFWLTELRAASREFSVNSHWQKRSMTDRMSSASGVRLVSFLSQMSASKMPTIVKKAAL